MSKTELFVRRQKGGMFTVVNEAMTTGGIYWVDSGSTTGGNTAGYGQNPDAPFLTLAYAITQCTADNGDMIFVMPGHAESIVAAGGIDLDVAGVKIVGLGEGRSRPVFTFEDNVNADIDISAANITMENLIFNMSTIDDLVTGIDVAAADFTLRNCYVILATDAEQALNGVGIGDNADRAKIEDCILEADFPGSNSAIDFTAVVNGAVIKDCHIYGDYDDAPIITTANPRYMLIDNNLLENENAGSEALDCTGAEGWITNNRLMSDGIATALNAGSCHCAGNLFYDIGETDVDATPIPVAVTTGGANLAGISDDIADVQTEVDKIGDPLLDTAASNLGAVLGDPGAANISARIAAVQTEVDKIDTVLEVQERCVAKLDGAVPAGNDDLFVISGGPILVTRFVGIVTTLIGANAATCTIQEAVAEPAGDRAISDAVNIEDDAAGTSYTFTAATPAVLTPTTNGILVESPVNSWLLPIGTVQAAFSAANDGVIAWYMTYKPLSPNSVVTVA